MNERNDLGSAQGPLVYILTGNIHSGKTAFLQSVCGVLKQKGVRLSGLLSRSLYSGDKIRGYDGYDLADERVFPLARIHTKQGNLRCGRFVFLSQGLEKARQALLKPGKFDWTVVDEMGPLELDRRGLWFPVVELLRRRRNLLLVIRRPLIADFIHVLPPTDMIFDMNRPDLSKTIVETLLKKRLT
ncbi:MAG: nucleoside-triphosphatase [Candidatus Aminicenantaceae bacterium]